MFVKRMLQFLSIPIVFLQVCGALRFQENLYEISKVKHGETFIIDVGMNHGEDTAQYLDQGYKVIAIEANPALAQANQEKFSAAIEAKRLTILNQAIVDQKGNLKFYVAKAMLGAVVSNETSAIFLDHLDEVASFNKSLACDADFMPCGPQSKFCTCEEINVQGTTCKQMIQTFGTPHYLKVDIEGFDGYCFKTLVDLPCDSLPEYLSFEEQSKTGFGKGGSSAEIIQALAPLGYKFKVTRQSLLDHMKSRTSGAFGENAQDYQQGNLWDHPQAILKRANKDCWEFDKQYVGGAFLCDVHAKLDRRHCKSQKLRK